MSNNSPSFRLLEVTVAPPEPDLQTPPATDAGEITAVEFDRVRTTALARDRKACQACGEPVARAAPHARATVWVEGAIGPSMKNPVFCDQGCWATWAGGE